MLVVIGSTDPHLGAKLAQVAEKAGLRKIRTGKLERMSRELKQPGRLAIIDIKWKEIHKGGVLRQLVNMGRISGNKLICMCPNDDEKLKKLAASARPDQVFIRYDFQTTFTDYLDAVAAESVKQK